MSILGHLILVSVPLKRPVSRLEVPLNAEVPGGPQSKTALAQSVDIPKANNATPAAHKAALDKKCASFFEDGMVSV